MDAATLLHLTESQVSELADGTLDSRERPVVLAHLGHCTDCRSQVAETRALLAYSRTASAAITAPPELWPLVAGATIHAPLRSSRIVLRATRVLLVVAFAILAVSLALSLRARLRDRAGDPAAAIAGGAAGAVVVPQPPHVPAPPHVPQPARATHAP
jgi:predicted anti-sigma-YlaC factor YlaD